MPAVSKRIQYNLLAVLACLLWSSSFAVSKCALQHQDPLNLAGLRFIPAGLIQLPLCGHPLAPLRMIRRETATVLWVSLFHTIYLYGTFFIGLSWVRGAEGAIMIGAAPLAAALMAHLLMRDDRMQRRTVVSLFFGIGGIILISLASEPWNPVGLKECCGLMLLLVSLPFEGLPHARVPAVFYGQLLWLAVISATAFSIWIILPDESPTWSSLAGMALIVTGIVIGQLESRRKPAAQA